jgi:hypothetical protein
MDAISFVLGIKSAQLRSKQLKDLVYRGRKLARGGYESTQEGDGDENDEEEDAGEGSARTAWVLAVYQDEEGEEYRFQRTSVESHFLLSLSPGRLGRLTIHSSAVSPSPARASTRSTTRSSPTPSTTRLSRSTTSSSKLATFSSSRSVESIGPYTFMGTILN